MCVHGLAEYACVHPCTRIDEHYEGIGLHYSNGLAVGKCDLSTAIAGLGHTSQYPNLLAGWPSPDRIRDNEYVLRCQKYRSDLDEKDDGNCQEICKPVVYKVHGLCGSCYRWSVHELLSARRKRMTGKKADEAGEGAPAEEGGKSTEAEREYETKDPEALVVYNNVGKAFFYGFIRDMKFQKAHGNFWASEAQANLSQKRIDLAWKTLEEHANHPRKHAEAESEASASASQK